MRRKIELTTTRVYARSTFVVGYSHTNSRSVCLETLRRATASVEKPTKAPGGKSGQETGRFRRLSITEKSADMDIALERPERSSRNFRSYKSDIFSVAQGGFR